MRPASMSLLPARTHWHLAYREHLSRRERRKLRRRPELAAEQRAWEAGILRRLNAVLKAVYSRESIAEMFPRETALRGKLERSGPLGERLKQPLWTVHPREFDQ